MTGQMPRNPGNKWNMEKHRGIATLIVCGLMRPGKREEVDTWMKLKDITIVLLQETRIGEDSRESRGEYTWYFSGRERTLPGYTAGVGIAIKTEWAE